MFEWFLRFCVENIRQIKGNPYQHKKTRYDMSYNFSVYEQSSHKIAMAAKNIVLQ
jgi:hypothetical protein